MAHNWAEVKVLVGKGDFIDEHGRVLHLRGVNVSGNSKLPTSPPGSSHLSEGFFDHRNVSFVGRPFPLEEADEHFSRLKLWGLTFIRWLVPWEALEHQGPGIYDEEYINFLIKLLTKAEEYGIKCFIDPHQDTWSRFSGGSGAPGWTFEVVGLDLTKFMETGAAYVHQSAQPCDSGHTAWPTNYQKLASATMFTVFFGGKLFAPNAIYQNEHPQEFLQRHFCACFQHLAQRLKHLPVVIGFEVINEPHFGYIGLKSMEGFNPLKDLHYGPTPSALQSMALASGIPQEVDIWVKSWPYPTRKERSIRMNSNGVSAWLPGCECIWRSHGVWDVGSDGKPQILVPDYFTTVNGKHVDFGQNCYLPFVERYSTAIRSVNPDLLIFFEPIPNEDPPIIQDESQYLVYSPHWYDLKALFSKSFNSFITHDVQGLSRGTKNVLSATFFGLAGAKKNYSGQIRNIVETGRKKVGTRPILFGECGIPMDMNEKKAFETGDYSQHTNFLDAMINALEESLVSFTLWNYNPHNDNVWGDHWNGEDFSIFSPIPSEPTTPARSRSSSRLGRHPLYTGETPNGLEDSTTDAPPASPTTPITLFDITEACFPESDLDQSHHLGGRALDAVIRPYASKIAGRPLEMHFDLNNLQFTLTFGTQTKSQPHASRVTNRNSSGGTPTEPASLTAGQVPKGRMLRTELFIPNFHYGTSDNLRVEVTDGEWEYDSATQTLYWYHESLCGLGPSVNAADTDEVIHRIVIRPLDDSRSKKSTWFNWLWR